LRSRRLGVPLVLGLAAVAIVWAGRGVTFLGDDWAWIFGALHFDSHTVFQSYNGHLLATTWVMYDLLLHLLGLGHPWVFRLVGVALHLAVAGLVYRLAVRRVSHLAALGIGGLIAVLGTAGDTFLSPLNLGILLATACALGALVALEHGSTRSDVAAFALLVVALASFTTAFAFLLGVVAELALKRDRRRLWVPAAAGALYVLWRLAEGGSSGTGGGLLDVPHHMIEAATGAVAGLAGIQINSPTLRSHLPWLGTAAQVLVALGIVGLVWVVVRRRWFTPRLVNLTVASFALWVLLALGRGANGDLYASRYVYMGAIPVALLLVEIGSYWRPRRRVVTIIAAGTGLAAALNLAWMVVWANHLRDESTTARAQLTALELARATAPSAFRLGSEFAVAPVEAGRYFAAQRRFGGSPAFSLEQLRAAPEPAREAADGVLARAGQIRTLPGKPRPGPGGRCLALSPSPRPTTQRDLTPAAGHQLLLTSYPPGKGLLVQARRFGNEFKTLAGGVRAGARPLLVAAHDSTPDRWRYRVTYSGRARACSTPTVMAPG
jgi:hypothetical protein